MKIIGIALSDEYTDISLVKEEYTYRFPTLLSREREKKRTRRIWMAVLSWLINCSLFSRKREVLLWQRNVMMPENFWLYF